MSWNLGENAINRVVQLLLLKTKTTSKGTLSTTYFYYKRKGHLCGYALAFVVLSGYLLVKLLKLQGFTTYLKRWTQAWFDSSGHARVPTFNSFTAECEFDETQPKGVTIRNEAHRNGTLCLTSFSYLLFCSLYRKTYQQNSSR